MAENELQSHTYLEDFPYHLVLDIARTLNEDGNWSLMARGLKDDVGDFVISEEEISHMKWNKSPGMALLDKLKQHDLQAQKLQYLLKGCQLYDILKKIVTNVPAQIRSPVTDVYCSIKLGKQVHIDVDVDGSPYPECQWYFKDSCLSGQNSCTMTIDNFSIKNQGEYICKVRQNLMGELVEQTSPTFILSVERMPPEIVLDLSDMEIETGRELVLICEAVGYPVPKDYRWYRNSEFITLTSESILKILRVDSLVSGLYYCEIWNGLGHCRSRLATVKVVPRSFAPAVPFDRKHPKVKPLNGLHSSGNFSGEEDPTHKTKVSSEDKHKCDLQYISEDNPKIKGCKPLYARNKWALLVANADYMPNHTDLHTPPKDMRVLARELRKLQFRCMLYSNLKKAEFSNAVCLFSEFLQRGDYVVFYYAGHGFSNNGIDFMMPLDTGFDYRCSDENIKPERFPQQEDCISTTWVSNTFQKAFPALLFTIYDTCRSQLSSGKMLSAGKDTYQNALANSYTLFATSENYSTYEGEESSYLMEHLAELVTKPIPVELLGQQVRQSYYRSPKDPQSIQVPKTSSDLARQCSLTDPAAPPETDCTEYGVLNRWESLGSVGGITEGKIQVADLELTVNIQCNPQNLSSPWQSQKDNPTWVISNCMDIMITIIQDDSPFDPSVVAGGLDLKIKPDIGKEILLKLRGKTSPIIYPFAGIQALKDSLSMELTFICKGTQCQKMFNLGRPPISKRFMFNILS